MSGAFACPGVMMLPIVYVARAGDDNEELRYSIRSVVKHLPHDSMTIAGHLPAWLDLPHIHVGQGPDKRRNIHRAIAKACQAFDRWILCWDDVFVMEPLDELPVMTGGPIEDHLATLDAQRHRIASLRRTGQWLAQQGIREPLCFDDIHVPQVIVSKRMKAALLAARAHGLGGVLTIHGNFARDDRPDPVRVANAKTTSADLDGRVFLSTNDRRFREEPIGEYIRAAFPDRSPHERDGLAQ